MKERLSCGNCGCSTFTICHLRRKDDSRLGGEGAAGTGTGIETKCTKCGSRSKITITRPTLTVLGDSKGSICGGWRPR